MGTLKFAALALAMVATTMPAKANDHSVVATENIEWGLLNPLTKARTGADKRKRH